MGAVKPRPPPHKLHARRGGRRDWRPKFLEVLAKTGIVLRACEAAGIARRTTYNARETEEAFALAWDEALEEGADVLEGLALDRAAASSDQLLIHLLKARRPGTHADRLRAELSGADGGPISIEARVTKDRRLEADAIRALEQLLARLEAHDRAPRAKSG